MTRRNDGPDRRRSRRGRPSRESGKAASESPPEPAEDPDLGIAGKPAMDREEVAAREAGIYDDLPPADDRPTREKTVPPRKAATRPDKRADPPRDSDWDLPEEEAPGTVDWWEDIQDEVESAREAEDASETPSPPTPPAREGDEAPEKPPAEPVDDGFDAGIFPEDPEPGEEEKEEKKPEPTEDPAATEDPTADEEPAADEKPEAIEEPEGDAETGDANEGEQEPGLPRTSPGVARRWVRQTWREATEKRPERRETFRTTSDEVLAPLYGPSLKSAKAFDSHVGYPGEFPFTRGVQATMYRGRLWTMRQYAGFASARATNERFRYLLSQGQTGLSVAFDLPTQIGYDSDDERSRGEVGKVGVPINSLRDMEILLEGIPLDEVSLSMTINSTALILLLMTAAVAKKQDVPVAALSGTVQNDMLKEFVARNTYRFPLDAHLRLVTDLFRYCSREIPRFNLISVSGYHMREAGCTASQEVAFTLANAIAYVERAVEAGLEVDDFAGRLSFFFAAHNHLFEEVAKFRAARRLWAGIMKDRFAAREARSMSLRFHTQTAGSTLTAAQPRTNVVRVTLQALAAVLGGTQSLHTNSFDEALGLPTREAALLALRTQQVIAHESGVTDVVDPLGGNPLVEELTDDIEKRAREYLHQIDEMGGAVAAIRSGWMKGEIEAAAYRAQQEIESGEKIVVGVNEYVVEEGADLQAPAVAEEQEKDVLADLAKVKEERDDRKAEGALAALEISAAWGDAELPELILHCVESYCTIGEICRSLESVLAGDDQGA